MRAIPDGYGLVYQQVTKHAGQMPAVLKKQRKLGGLGCPFQDNMFPGGFEN